MVSTAVSPIFSKDFDKLMLAVGARVSTANTLLNTVAPALPAALLDADFEQGASTYLSKHFGGGMGRRVSAALGALGTLKIGLFTNLVSGQKVDGSQE